MPGDVFARVLQQLFAAAAQCVALLLEPLRGRCSGIGDLVHCAMHACGGFIQHSHGVSPGVGGALGGAAWYCGWEC